MKRYFTPLALLLIPLAVGVAASPTGQAAPPEFVLTGKPVRRIEAVHTYDVAFPNFKAKEWIVLAAAGPELPSQRNVSTKLTPEGKIGTELSELKRPIVWAAVTAAGEEQKTHFRYSVTYRVTLFERKLTPAPKGMPPPKVIPLTEVEKKWYLAATAAFYDYEAKPFQEWLDKLGLRIKDGEGEVKFARRVFLTIADTCSYEARQNSDLRASAICQAGKSHCGGLSALFVASLRANRVPARSLVGNWAETSKPGQKIGDFRDTKQHVRAEFFAAGIGWIPVDPSSAVYWFKGKRETMLRECFGVDAGNFFVKQVDYDLIFDSGAFGRQTVPWAWCSAWPVGEGEVTNPTLNDDWKVRLLPEDE